MPRDVDMWLDFQRHDSGVRRYRATATGGSHHQGLLSFGVSWAWISHLSLRLRPARHRFTGQHQISLAEQRGCSPSDTGVMPLKIHPISPSAHRDRFPVVRDVIFTRKNRRFPSPRRVKSTHTICRRANKLLGVIKVAVISVGNWPQFQKQVLSHLTGDKRLKNLSLLPTCGTQFYKYEKGWRWTPSEHQPPGRS